MKKSTITISLAILILALAGLITYIAFDHNRTDTEPPVIQVSADELYVSVKDPQDVLLAGVTVYDNIDGDLTNAVFIESIYGITKDHSATVTYAVCDRSGNVTKMERTVYYTDYHSPRFALNQALVYEYGTVFDVMKNVSATDVFDKNISRNIKATLISNSLSVTSEGIHDVQFRVTNSMGDTVQLILPVEVYPANRYDATLELTDYIIYLSKGSHFKADRYLLRLNVYGTSVPLNQADIRINGTVDTSVPGIYPVSYTASYTENNRTSLGYSKLIVIVEE